MIIFIILIILIILILHLSVQIRIQQGIPEQIWANKRCMLAKTVDDLGEIFRPTLQAAWLAFIKKKYPVDQPGQPVVGAFFVQDDD